MTKGKTKAAKQKAIVFVTIDDLVRDFLYYDRKEDEELPRGVIEELVEDGKLTVDEMVACFRKHLEEGLGEDAGDDDGEDDGRDED